MTRQPIEGSTNIRSVGFAETGQSLGILEVEFRSGGVYRYFGVPASIYAGLLAAKSKGGYLHRAVIAAGFQTVRVEPSPSAQGDGDPGE